jgi:hypothetical protein
LRLLAAIGKSFRPGKKNFRRDSNRVDFLRYVGRHVRRHVRRDVVRSKDRRAYIRQAYAPALAVFEGVEDVASAVYPIIRWLLFRECPTTSYPTYKIYKTFGESRAMFGSWNTPLRPPVSVRFALIRARLIAE